MTKLKVWRDFFKDKLNDLKGEPKLDGSGEGKRKNKGRGECEEEEQEEEGKGQKMSDFITTDFVKINDSMLGGYVTRDGEFPYIDERTGKTIVKYKDWNNLKEAYGNLDKVIGYGSKYKDSHYESDSRMIGYWDSFKFIEKGMPGIYAEEGVPSHDPNYNKKMDIDEKHNRVWSRLNTNKDIAKLSDLPKEELKKLPVSASYEDLGYGTKQVVGKVYHIATSLNKNEQDRCSAMGTACNVSIMDTIHDHSLKKVESATDSDTNNKGVSRALVKQQDFTEEPPKIKKKKEKAMGKDKKTKDAKEEDMVEEDTVEEDVADGENKIMKGGEKKYPKGKVAGDDDEVEDKIKGSPYQENEKIKKSKDMESEIADLKNILAEQNDFIKGLKPILESVTKRNADLVTKEENDMKSLLIKEPYSFTEDHLKDKSLAKLSELKEDFEQTKAYNDFKEQTESNDFAFADVNKTLFDESQPRSILADFIDESTRDHWGWQDQKTKLDFFKEGIK